MPSIFTCCYKYTSQTDIRRYYMQCDFDYATDLESSLWQSDVSTMDPCDVIQLLRPMS